MGEAMSRRIRGVFNAANFWAIVLYNVLALNNLEFAKLVGKRLIYKGRNEQGFYLVKVGRGGFFPVVSSQSENHRERHEKKDIINRIISHFYRFFSSIFSPSLFLLPGFPLSSLSVLLVTYCGVQLVKERERRQALLADGEPAKPVDGGKEKAE